MRNSKVLISQALKTIQGNIERTGDPLGLKVPYWTKWADNLNLSDHGSPLLFTARMYQMLPYVVQTTEMAAKAQPLVPMLSVKLFSKMAEYAGALAGDPIIRLGARREGEIRKNVRNRPFSALSPHCEKPVSILPTFSTRSLTAVCFCTIWEWKRPSPPLPARSIVRCNRQAAEPS